MKMKVWALKKENVPLAIISCADMLPIRIGDKPDPKSATIMSPEGTKIAVLYLSHGCFIEEMAADSSSTPMSELPKDS